MPAHPRLDAEGDLGQRIRRLIRRMQFRRAPHHAILDVGDDDGAVVGAFGGIALDEAVIHEAVESVMAACRIKPKQMVAQQRQFFLLAQRPDAALGRGRAGGVFVVHFITPLG